MTVEASYTGLFSGDTRYTDLLYKTLSVGLILMLCPARLNPPTLNMSFTGLATESLPCQPLIVAWLSYSDARAFNGTFTMSGEGPQIKF